MDVVTFYDTIELVVIDQRGPRRHLTTLVPEEK
jgi:hypothetical protein